MKSSPMPGRGDWLKRRQRRNRRGPFRQVAPTFVAIVVERAAGGCERCGSPLQGVRGVDWSIHHRRPRSVGGGNRPANLLVLCGDGATGCHGWVTENPKLAAAEGTHLWSWQDPVEVPLLTLGRVVLLSDDGAVRAA